MREPLKRWDDVFPNQSGPVVVRGRYTIPFIEGNLKISRRRPLRRSDSLPPGPAGGPDSVSRDDVFELTGSATCRYKSAPSSPLDSRGENQDSWTSCRG